MRRGQGRKYVIKGVIVLIWVIGIWLRWNRLVDIPAGIHVDEAGMAYDAWCLGTYGTDRFLNRWPVYLINYGSGQSAMYAYLAMLCMKIGGVNLWMIRMPAFLSGCMVMIFGTLIAQKCFLPKKEAYRENSGLGMGSRRIGMWAVVLTALLLAVCPYFIMASRMGFDCNLMLGFATITLYVLLVALERRAWLKEMGQGRQKFHRKGIGWFIGVGVMIGLTLYTYSLSWMVMPFFLLFALLYLWRQKRLSVSTLLAMGIPAFVLALPLLLFVVVNKGEFDSIRVLWFTVPRIPYFRTDHFQVQNIADNALILKKLLTTDQYTFNAVKPFGTLYPFTIPFVLLGIGFAVVRLVQSVRKRIWDMGSLVFLWFLAQMLCALITKDPDIYRTNGIYFSLVYLAVLGMQLLLWGCELLVDWISRSPEARGHIEKRKQYAVASLGVVFGIVYVYLGGQFANYYFNHYTEEYPVQWFINDYVDEIMEVFRDVGEGQKIYFDNYNCSLYAYDCLIRGVSPYDWNQDNDMYTQEEDFGNRHYYLPAPEEIEDDAWYVVMDDSGFGANLEKLGFQWNTYGYYKVYFKPSQEK